MSIIYSIINTIRCFMHKRYLWGSCAGLWALMATLAAASDWQWHAINTIGNWAHNDSYSVISSCGAACPFPAVSSTEGSNSGGWLYPYDRREQRMKDDFDGDGKTDNWYYYASSRIWYVVYSSATQTVTRISFGLENAVPIPEDYDGDHLTDFGIYQESSGTWTVLLSSQAYTANSVIFGGPGYLAIPADFDGDQKADPIVYHRVSGLWTAMQSASGYQTVSSGFGGTGYTAFTGDYDEDDKADPVVYNEGLAAVVIALSGSSTAFRRNPYSTVGAGYGGPGYTLLAADYDGDGCADLAAYNRDSGLWFVINYKLEQVIWGRQWGGGASYQPLAGDYDGDGLADPAVFYRTRYDAVWHMDESTAGPQSVSARGDRR